MGERGESLRGDNPPPCNVHHMPLTPHISICITLLPSELWYVLPSTPTSHHPSTTPLNPHLSPSLCHSPQPPPPTIPLPLPSTPTSHHPSATPLNPHLPPSLRHSLNPHLSPSLRHSPQPNSSTFLTYNSIYLPPSSTSPPPLPHRQGIGRPTKQVHVCACIRNSRHGTTTIWLP